MCVHQLAHYISDDSDFHILSEDRKYVSINDGTGNFTLLMVPQFS
jgi:hypothetical protein